MKQPQNEQHPPMPHLLTLSERRALTVSGVRDVRNFDDLTVEADTEQGLLTVKGSGLHISRLNTETGDLTLEGQVDSLTYSHTETHTGGFWGRLFR